MQYKNKQKNKKNKTEDKERKAPSNGGTINNVMQYLMFAVCF